MKYMITARGKIKGNTVVLDDDLGCYDGSDAVVVITPVENKKTQKTETSESYTQEEMLRLAFR